MTELHPLLQDFYEEIEPKKRHNHLKEYLEAAGGAKTPADEYRVALFNSRHADSNKPGSLGLLGMSKARAKKTDTPAGPAVLTPPGEMDAFLRVILVLLTIYKNPGFFPKKNIKEVLSLMDTLMLDDRASNDQDCQEAFYLEMRNAVKRFFSTCHDSSYGRKLLGLSASSNEEKERLRCFDTWGFSFGIARLLQLEQELDILCRAANDEYCASAPDAESLESAYKKMGGKEKKR